MICPDTLAAGLETAFTRIQHMTQTLNFFIETHFIFSVVRAITRHNFFEEIMQGIRCKLGVVDQHKFI